MYLANKRGEAIARERAKRTEQVTAGKLVQVFVDSKGIFVMEDESRRELLGRSAILLSTRAMLAIG